MWQSHPICPRRVSGVAWVPVKNATSTPICAMVLLSHALCLCFLCEPQTGQLVSQGKDQANLVQAQADLVTFPILSAL
ncbi:hypothetical protein BC939DRAFT_294539 [Gamsiella multidivaricata]|uniref:uncharacterized protein n=1 Tax=Gamsiella multidivaricata TaxID=101098 RepID=UPI00221F84B0|nr:uncharacterized protein BC939DRAFT_294539 [Gamsiella multidivaricata]KAI7818418.1 hypothetical protein BC939DRAFT_294539 [Gamsiella multidivaricata]